eukprot:TRINITY_DN24905_c0_g1_i1.p1 TRINITY_DN24905_c0_g1~~TRINITY_DN24905_c0_g1_i1.p1  ORF type:complete len:165 (+),score=34.16 TRINITY_DN24905_c0_g1_i1:62-556(+)
MACSPKRSALARGFCTIRILVCLAVTAGLGSSTAFGLLSQWMMGSGRARPLPEVHDLKDFNQMLEHDGPVIAMFSSPLCGPCKLAEPMLQKLTKRHGSQLRIFKVQDGSRSQDAFEELSSKLEVHALPTFVVYSHGQMVSKLSGIQAVQPDADSSLWSIVGDLM